MSHKVFVQHRDGKETLMRSLLAASVALFAMGVQHVSAQSTTWVTGLAHGVKAVLYRPNSNPSSHVGVIIIHRTSNYLNHAGCTQLSQRGLTVLCMNSRFDNNETLVNWELIAQDVGAGVTYLKSIGMTRVVLFGHSGGGPTTTYYQAVAENGPSYCQGANKLSECATSGPNSVAGLTPADGIVLADAHPSNAVNLLRGMNPAITEGQDKDRDGLHTENEPITPIANLDPWSPANGFVANGLSHYSMGFQKRYSRAQAARMNAWIEHAQRIQAKAAEGDYRFPDDDNVVIARAGGSVAGGGNEAALWKMDTSILCCTVQPEMVLQNNASVVTQYYTSVRLPSSTDYPGNLSFDTGTKNLTVTSFLSANAIRSTDAMDYSQIDWCSSNNSTPCALQHVSVPLLITAMGAYYFIDDGEQYFLHYAKSADKTFVIAAGLVHGITPCGNCPGGPYNNMVMNYWNYVFNWISTRFGT
jgi:hypothetical protein